MKIKALSGVLGVAAFIAVAAGGLHPAVAQYPDRPLTVIVPFPPGGASDVTARLVSPKLSEQLGQSVVVDNKAGANGAIGAAAVKQAKPDGYTLLVGSIGVFGINPALFRDLRYDPLKDFDLLSVIVRTPNVLVVNPSFPAKTVGELVEYLKKNPDKVSFASSGTGSSDHLTAALFLEKTGATGVHVPYKGGGPAINDLVAGQVNASFQNLGAIVQQVRAGKLRALAVTSATRVPALPDVPTMAEAGVKDLEVYSWQAAAAPRGLPAAVKEKLVADLAAAARSPDVKAQFEQLGFEVVAGTGQQFDTFLAGEIGRWRQVIEAAKITVE
ncbi:Tripartite-type tricarboxylate transporter, receptor component TctC [Enhydrobacter aerosaccus]|uniref:Tripartite-type tricarboxylate transporter, receptor component TctC n=1 Tax=Enhydrobacter aerosaccus TaxID=225324 RepID=A0A1T4TFF3_9HYPH|nr:tripartite tricarboxylate transporter substrate binding protein [Enhydrobacter aerosaccus]SKA38929.1 Tripartite-type tricarboxylate transporter, receptor component TctC [Enhydrobacter aerosaccus]